jgi:hypothetical protein
MPRTRAPDARHTSNSKRALRLRKRMGECIHGGATRHTTNDRPHPPHELGHLAVAHVLQVVRGYTHLFSGPCGLSEKVEQRRTVPCCAAVISHGKQVRTRAFDRVLSYVCRGVCFRRLLSVAMVSSDRGKARVRGDVSAQGESNPKSAQGERKPQAYPQTVPACAPPPSTAPSSRTYVSRVTRFPDVAVKGWSQRTPPVDGGRMHALTAAASRAATHSPCLPQRSRAWPRC